MSTDREMQRHVSEALRWERNIDPERLYALIGTQVEAPLWGIFGEARVQVLALNLALDKLAD